MSKRARTEAVVFLHDITGGQRSGWPYDDVRQFCFKRRGRLVVPRATYMRLILKKAINKVVARRVELNRAFQYNLTTMLRTCRKRLRLKEIMARVTQPSAFTHCRWWPSKTLQEYNESTRWYEHDMSLPSPSDIEEYLTAYGRVAHALCDAPREWLTRNRHVQSFLQWIESGGHYHFIQSSADTAVNSIQMWKTLAPLLRTWRPPHTETLHTRMAARGIICAWLRFRPALIALRARAKEKVKRESYFMCNSSFCLGRCNRCGNEW